MRARSGSTQPPGLTVLSPPAGRSQGPVRGAAPMDLGSSPTRVQVCKQRRTASSSGRHGELVLGGTMQDLIWG